MEITPVPNKITLAPQSTSLGLQLLQFAIQLAVVYFIANYLEVWLAGWIHNWILPILAPKEQPSRLQFLFSHIFAFSFVTALVAGFIYGHYRAVPALFVWIVPSLILAYKFVTFPAGVFENHFQVAFHYYFGRDFIVGEFHSYRELFQIANSDMTRGMDQLRITGPFYASLGYCVGVLIALRVQIPAVMKMIRGAKYPVNYPSDTTNSS